MRRQINNSSTRILKSRSREARLGKRIGKLNDESGGKAATQGFQVGYQDDS
jgi:hypothetical protein